MVKSEKHWRLPKDYAALLETVEVMQ